MKNLFWGALPPCSPAGVFLAIVIPIRFSLRLSFSSIKLWSVLTKSRIVPITKDSPFKSVLDHKS